MKSKFLLAFFPLSLATVMAYSSMSIPNPVKAKQPILSYEQNTANNYYPNVADVKSFVKQSKITAVLFNAPWSGPGKMAAAKYKALATKFNDKKANFGVVDAEKNERDAKGFGVKSIPTVVVFVDGSVVKSFEGARAIGIDLEPYLSKL